MKESGFAEALASVYVCKGIKALSGETDAWGRAAVLYLAHVLRGYPLRAMRGFVSDVKEEYGTVRYGCNDYDAIISFLSENSEPDAQGAVLALPDASGSECMIAVSRDLLVEALDFLRDGI